MNDEIIRQEAMDRHQKGERVSKICANLGRSTRWFYTWRKRYLSGDPMWFRDRPRAPKSIFCKTQKDIRDLIVRIRNRLEAMPGSNIGAKAIQVELKRKGITPPAVRTIDRILKIYNLVKKTSVSRKISSKSTDDYSVKQGPENGTLRRSGELLMGFVGVAGAEIKPDPGRTVQGKERRGARRFKIRLPVLISGTTKDGKEFSEKTALEDLSTQGAYIPMKHKVEKNFFLIFE